MPPLHRMPVVYLAGVAVAAVVAIASAGRRGEAVRAVDRPGPAAAAKRDAAPPPALAGERPSVGDPADSDAILRTAEGLRRKVVVTALGTVPRRQAGGPPASLGAALDYFSIHYVYGEAPGWFQVGPRGGHPIGWAAAASVLEWPTRLMVRPMPRGDRPALVLYRHPGCARAAAAGGPCPDHGSACPTEGEEGEGDWSASAAGLPILRSEAAGDSGAIFEVASLVQDRAPPAPPARLPAEMLAALRRIDVAFVMDTTASMQGSLDQARELAEELAAEAARRHGDVILRLALVEYRDAAPAYGFRARVTAPFGDPAGFRRTLDGVRVAKAGDGSVDEQVLEGVALALPPEPDAPDAGRHLEWPTGRAGELATKMIVLLGDAPDHDRDSARAEHLAGWAKRCGITVAAVTIPRGDRSRDEEARYQAQWRALAEGSHRPLDRSADFQRPMAPALVELGGADDLVARLRVLLDDRLEQARSLAALAAAEAERRLEPYLTSQGLSLEQVYPVLVDLHRGEERPQARPDPRAEGRKAPSVRRGWIAERAGGTPLVSVGVLMSRPELDALIGELLAVQEAAQGTARDLDALLQIGTAAAAGETAFLAADRGTTTFADHLRRRQGLPPARADSLLRATQKDLLQADPATRAALDERLGESIERLIGRRNEADWDDPRRTVDGMALVPFEWIDF